MFIIASIASIVLLYLFLRWAGWRGIAAFFIGMGLMAYLLLSKNAMLMYIIDSTKSEEYIDEITKKEKDKRDIIINKN